jgi:beta-glucosidase
MKRKLYLHLFLIGTFISLIISCKTNQTTYFSLQARTQPLLTNETQKQVDALYNKMSQQERIAQLRGLNMNEVLNHKGELDTIRCQELLANGIGHFCQFASGSFYNADSLRNQVALVQNWLTHHTTSKIPALFHEEVITGVAARNATVYPQQIGMACTFNPKLALQKTRYTAADLRSIGGMMALSPMIDVVRNPHFNRLEESYGEDGYLSAAMGVSFVKGLQYGGLKKGIAACSKHFLGYGGGSDAPQKELMEDILMPHEAVIRIAGSKVVMTGYHKFHGINCVANPEIIQNILRKYLKFDGLMVSDYGSINQISETDDKEHKAAKAINAGNDVDFQEGECYQYLLKAIDQGLVNQQTLEKAVKRVLALKYRLGLIDSSTPLWSKGHISLDRIEERQLAYHLATQSIVLLKNNNVLPIKKTQKIFLTGPNANSMWAMLGDYTYQSMSFFWRNQLPSANEPKIVNLKEGMEAKLPSECTLCYTRGCDWTEKNETKIQKGGDPRTEWIRKMLNRRIPCKEKIDTNLALKEANRSDIIVAAVGENAMLCGENRDRGSLRLPGRQEQYIEKLLSTGKPLILIVFGGRSQVISKIADRCAAIIQAWYPGEEGGNALADILYGNVSPSGKLSVSYPSEELNEPICYNYSLKPNPKIEFPFGFGLSYNTYTYSKLKIDKCVKTNAKVIHLSFDITNNGDYSSDEIAEIYLSPADSSLHIKPIQLQGFGRIHLAPHQTVNVKFLMSPQQFGYYDKGKWSIDSGKYIIKVGASSADIRLKDEIILKGNKKTMPLRTVYFAEIQK